MLEIFFLGQINGCHMATLAHKGLKFYIPIPVFQEEHFKPKIGLVEYVDHVLILVFPIYILNLTSDETRENRRLRQQMTSLLGNSNLLDNFQYLYHVAH